MPRAGGWLGVTVNSVTRLTVFFFFFLPNWVQCCVRGTRGMFMETCTTRADSVLNTPKSLYSRYFPLSLLLLLLLLIKKGGQKTRTPKTRISVGMMSRWK